MENRHIIFIARSMLALFLAIHVWVWLRYAGAFWLSDSMEFMAYLTKSVAPLKTSLTAFLLLLLPTLIASHFTSRELARAQRILLFMALATAFSLLYLLSISGWNLSFIARQVWVYLSSGAVAGLVYALILHYSRNPTAVRTDDTVLSHTRRRLLGSLGLLAGATGLLGSLSGPFYFWRNRNTYVDVDLSRLEDGQLMSVEVANKPVWILRRTPEVIHLLGEDNPRLLDPNSDHSEQPIQAMNRLRSLRPEYFIAYGICTHLGCSPNYRPTGFDGDERFSTPAPHFFCPCHGGLFDLAGRVYKNTPPPVNMIVPEHTFISDSTVRFHFPSVAQELNS